MASVRTLKEILEENNITIKELSEKIGIPATTLYSSCDKPITSFKLETVQKISFALDIELTALVTAQDVKKMISAEAKEIMNEQIKSGEIRVIESDEQELVSDYLKLNKNGKNKAREYVKDLTLIPDYTKKDPDQ